MEIINNRFRILETKYSNRMMSCYIVKDILIQEENVYRIYIISPQLMPSIAMQKLINDFQLYIGIDHPYFVKGLEVDMVFSIDRKPVDRVNYFFLIEEFDFSLSFINYAIKAKSFEEILDKYVETLKVFEIMNRRGFFYEFLSEEHIYVDDNFNIKIKDIILTHIDHIKNSIVENRKNLIYRAPELYTGSAVDVQSIIYALGITLKNIYENCTCEKNQLKKIKPIIEKMTAYKLNERYESISNVIDDINLLLKKKYTILFDNKTYYVNRKPNLIVRDSIKKSIFEAINRLKTVEGGILLYELRGDRNTGKTKGLRYIRKQLSLNGVDIFSSFDEDRLIKKNNTMVPVVSKILAEKGYDVINKFEKVNNYIKNGVCEKNDYTSYSQISSFIKLALDNQITAIVIDNLKETDVNSIEIIKYLMYEKKHKEKILIIYTTEDNIPLEKTISYTINNLTIDESTQLIKSILCIDYNPIEISTRIYKDTIGNVKHMKSILFDLIDQEILQLDEAGKWIFKIDKYDDLKIAEDSFEAPQKYLELLNFIQQESVINLSLFKNPSTAEEIASVFSTEVKFIEIVENLMELTKFRVLITQFNDDGYCYEFEDRAFKKRVYDNIPENIRQEKHIQITDNIITNAKSLEIQVKGKVLDELIFHLKKAKRFKEASIYSILKADEFFKTGLRLEALDLDKEAIEFAILSEDSLRLIITLHKAAERLFLQGDLTKAEDYYKVSVEVSLNIENYRVALITLTKLINVYLLLSQYNLASDCLNQMKKYLTKDKSLRALLDYNLSNIKYYVRHFEYDIALSWIEKTEKLCQGKYKRHYAWVLYNKGIIYHDNGYEYEKLIELHDKILKLFFSVNDLNGIALTYNSFAFIYSEYLLDNKKAIYYFRIMKDYAEKHKINHLIAMSNFNLGEQVLRDLNYEESIELFNRTIENFLILKRKDLLFYTYVYMASVMSEIMDFSNAAIYIKKAEYLFDDTIKEERAILLFYEVKATVNLFVGDEQLSNSLAIDMDNFGIKLIGFENNTSSVLKLYLKISKVKLDSELDDILDGIFNYNKELSLYSITIKKFLDLSMICKFFNRNELISDIYSWVLDNMHTQENTRARKYQDYMKYYLEDESTRIQKIEELLTKLDYRYDTRLIFQINLLLSEEYLKEKKYFVGISYIIENIIIIKEKILSFNKDIILDNFYGSILFKLLSQILTIEGLNLPSILEIDIFNPDIEAVKNIINDNLILKYLLKEPNFINEAKKYLNWDLEDLNTDNLIEGLKYSNIGNMEVLLKHIMGLSWAQAGGIILRQEKELNCIVNINDLRNSEELEMIFNQVDILQDTLIVSEFAESKNPIYANLLVDKTKGFMCIPLYTDSLQHNERRIIKKNIVGYLYVESNFVLNSFTEDTYNTIKKFINLLTAFIDNYNLSLKYSIDKLTSAYNRQFFDLFIKNELDNIQGVKSIFSLVIMDIDLFKSVNDNFGHSFGDITLRRFSKIVQNEIRSYDMFARYGGEEFVLILKSTDSNEAFKIADRIRNKIYNELKDLNGKPITVSMGISTYPEHGTWEEELVNKADLALYKAKDTGRNKVCIWDNTMNNSDVFNRKKENIMASLFGDNHARANLFVSTITLLKEKFDPQEDFNRYLIEALKYFEAEKLFIIKFGKNGIDYIVKTNLQGNFVLNSGFEKLFNINIVKNSFEQEKSIYLTDWEKVSKIDELTGMPEWDSVLCTPIVYMGEKKGVIYMSSPVRIKEFGIVDIAVSQILAPIIGNFL